MCQIKFYYRLSSTKLLFIDFTNICIHFQKTEKPMYQMKSLQPKTLITTEMSTKTDSLWPAYIVAIEASESSRML